MYIPKITSENTIYENKWRRIVEKKLESKTWVEQSFPIMSQAGSKYCTMIFPFTQEWDVVYCKEWRPWIEWFVYNFPIGIHESELSFEENAQKELLEEVWCVSQTWLISIWENIVMNFDDTIVKYFFAPECLVWENSLEDWENIEVQKTSLTDFEAKIISWEINCPLTISCFSLAKLQKLI